MRKLLGRRPSPAMVVACLALLVALTGTSVAAVNQLGRNTVGPLQIKNGAVTNPKIRNNAVTSAKVANRSLLRSDFAPGQLPAGPTGPQGPVGPAGPAGAAGPAGTIGAITVRSANTAIQDTTVNGQFVTRVGRRALLERRACDIRRDRVERQQQRPGVADRTVDADHQLDESGRWVPRRRSERRRRDEHVHGVRPLLPDLVTTTASTIGAKACPP